MSDTQESGEQSTEYVKTSTSAGEEGGPETVELNRNPPVPATEAHSVKTRTDIPHQSGLLSLSGLESRLASDFADDEFPLSSFPDYWDTRDPEVPRDLFLSRRIVRGILLGIVSAIASAVAMYITSGTVSPIIATIAAGAFTVVSGGYMSLTIGRSVVTARARADQIDKILSDAIAFMYAQSEGGTSIYTVISAMADADDAYGPVAEEFNAVTQRCEYFGVELTQALREQANSTPSEQLSRLFSDMVTFIESGGEITEFLSRESDRAFDRLENEQQEQLDFIDLVSTLYIPFSTVPVLVVLIMAGVSSFRPIGSLPLALFGYVFSPLVPITFILLTNLVQPYTNKESTLSVTTKDRIINSPVTDDSEQAHSHAETDGGEKHATPGKQHSDLRTRDGVFGGFLRGRRGGKETPTALRHPAENGISPSSQATALKSTSEQFSRIPLKERLIRLQGVITDPLGYLRVNPTLSLVLSLPAAFAAFALPIYLGYAPSVSVDALISTPVTTTMWWGVIPTVVALMPLSLFHELDRRSRLSLREQFPDALQKISSANETGMTLFDSLRSASTERGTQIDTEVKIIEQKVALGATVEKALVEFANARKDPQVSRITRLLIEAQRASERVSNVLDVAIRSALARQRLRDQHSSETKSYITMITLTTLVVVAAAGILSRTLVPLIGGTQVQAGAGGPIGSVGLGASTGDGINVEILRTILFHISLQYSLLGGLFAGFISTGELKSGIKYSLGGMSLATLMWLLLGTGIV